MEHETAKAILHYVRTVDEKISALHLALIRKGLVKESDLATARERLSPVFTALADSHAQIGTITEAQLGEACGRIAAAEDLAIEKIRNEPGPAPINPGGRHGRRKRRK